MRAVDGYLARAGPPQVHIDELTALIAPHAGLMYSGPVAAHAYACLRARLFPLIVLVGPSHFVGFDGVSIVPRGGFETPFGVAHIDEACAAALMRATPIVFDYPAAHAREHSLEMQLPFVQQIAPRASIVPLLMGYQSAQTSRTLGEVLGEVLKNRGALLVASTDLSHFHDRVSAAQLDRVVLNHLARFDTDGMQRALDARPEHACGGGPLVAVMHAARALGAQGGLVLNYADSGDVSGDVSSVVGYLAGALGRFSIVS